MPVRGALKTYETKVFICDLFHVIFDKQNILKKHIILVYL